MGEESALDTFGEGPGGKRPGDTSRRVLGGALAAGIADGPWELTSLACTTSTNEIAARSAKPWQIITAGEQTAGRGRRGRTWTTPPGTALLVSFTVPMAADPQRWGWLPLLAGLAVRDTLRGLPSGRGERLDVQLKWPNDVLISDRKAAGVLCANVSTAGGWLGVVGIGLNVRQRQEELPIPEATSLAIEGVDCDPDHLVAPLAAHLLGRHEQWHDSAGLSSVRAEYVDACASVGQEVTVLTPGQTPVIGMVSGVAEGGELILRAASGGERRFSAGDVVHARLDRGLR